MVLEQFIIDADIIWDQVGKTFFENPEAKAGRIMRVQVVNAGVVEDLTGYTLNLGWTSVRDPSKFGLDAFDAVDLTKGIFEIDYTSEMLTNIGPLNAALQLVPPSEGRPVESNNFKLTVKNSAINAEAIQGENSFSTLETALVKVNDWNARIDDVEQDFKDRADALDGAYPVRLTAAEQLSSQAATKADTASLKADAMASGSPKGVYATLALLQAAYPTGTTGAYLVSADGKWYYWSGSAWTSGGTYQGTSWQEGINARTDIGGTTHLDIDDRIKFSENGNLAVSGYSALNRGYKKQFIGKWEIGGINGGTGVPATANYMTRTPDFITGTGQILNYDVTLDYRLNVIKYDGSQVYVSSTMYGYVQSGAITLESGYLYKFTFGPKSATTPPITDMSDYLAKLFLVSTADRLKFITDAEVSSLYGITWNAVGDSITFEQLYVNRVLAATGLVSTGNKGINSSTVAINNSFLTAQSMVERVLGLNGNVAYGDAQIWTLFGGINDYQYNTPMGDITSTDNATFYGALKSICANILQRTNKPKLVLLAPMQSWLNFTANTLGLYPIDYVNAVIEVAGYYSIKVVDLYRYGGINSINRGNAQAPGTTRDGLHPTDYGTALYYPHIVAELESLDFDYLNY